MKDSIQSIMQPDGSLRCARCGGTQFEAKRSTGMKVAFGLASLLASANEVQCVACGTKYLRRTPAVTPVPTPPKPNKYEPPPRPDTP
jgi:DNA-directed RNA polymerase subunit RPC12/RpoP